MRLQIFTIILFFITNTAFASNTHELPDFSFLVDRINADIDKDGIEDNAYLTSSTNDDGSLDLWVSLSTSTGFYKTPSVAWNNNGPVFGQGSELVVNPLGSLVVHSYNDAIGRTRWDRKVTFAHRNNELVLAGYTWHERDTLNLSNMTCDMNLLNRKANVEGSIFRGFDANEEPKLANYSGSFEVAKEDVLSVFDANIDNIGRLYVEDYCYSIPGEIAGDLGEAEGL